jgi:opacity protein-like surface antigen
MRPSPAKFSLVAVFVLAALGSAGREARAQAWVGDTGGLDLSLDYNLGISDKVVADGDEMDFKDAGSTTHQLTLGAEYVPIRSLAVNVSLPFSMLKYTGSPDFAHPGGGTYDDGSLHSTLTDLRVGARYQVLEAPVALSPHLGVSIPVADYETVGNTVAGRHLKALHVGLGIGRVIGTATYVHLLYEFSLVEKYDRTPETEKHGQNRSDLAFTIGHKLLDQRLDLHADFNGRITHGGIGFSEFAMLSMNEQLYHDAILKEDIFLVGAGVGYQITNRVAATLSGRYFVAGTNTQNASVIALGVSWSPLPR